MPDNSDSMGPYDVFVEFSSITSYIRQVQLLDSPGSRPFEARIRLICRILVARVQRFRHEGWRGMKDRGPFSELGERLTQGRREARLKQGEVAERMGVTRDTLSRWERGVHEPGFTHFTALAEIYSVSLDWLAGRTQCKSTLKPGHTLVDLTVIHQLREAEKNGHTLVDMKPITRAPGYDYAWDIPENHQIIDRRAAKQLQEDMDDIAEQLRSGSDG